MEVSPNFGVHLAAGDGPVRVAQRAKARPRVSRALGGQCDGLGRSASRRVGMTKRHLASLAVTGASTRQAPVSPGRVVLLFLTALLAFPVPAAASSRSDGVRQADASDTRSASPDEITWHDQLEAEAAIFPAPTPQVGEGWRVWVRVDRYWGEGPTEIVLEGNGKRCTGRFRQLAILGTERQLRLLRRAYPVAPISELALRLRVEELVFGENDGPDLDPQAMVRELASAAVALAPLQPNEIVLDAPTYRFEYWSGGALVHRLRSPEVTQPAGLAPWFHRWSNRLHTAWITRQATSGWPAVLAGLDATHDGADWFNAACWSAPALARVLLEQGVDLVHADAEGRLPIENVVITNDAYLVRRVLDQVDTVPSDNFMEGPLTLGNAIPNASAEIVRLLLSHGGRVTERHIQLANEHGRRDLVPILKRALRKQDEAAPKGNGP